MIILAKSGTEIELLLWIELITFLLLMIISNVQIKSSFYFAFLSFLKIVHVLPILISHKHLSQDGENREVS